MEITFLGDLAGKVYSLRIEQDEYTTGGKCFMAYHPELVGCKSQGDTIQEAVANLENALTDYIDVMRYLNQPVPVPNSHLPITR